MRIVHSADWHIGFRAYQRSTPSGINQREADVARTFVRFIDAVIAIAPDVVVAAGDLFHESKPSNAAIVHLHAQLSRLTRALPRVLVVLVGGNHDLVRASYGGDILPLLGTIDRVHVIDRAPRRLHFADRNLSILGVPDAPGMKRPTLEPDPDARFNLLVLHGEVEGMLSGKQGDRVVLEISKDEIAAPRWDYCALGHWHQYRELAPNMFYSGSIDFTSSNPWQEIATPKGFIERNLETGAHVFHELPASRVYLDLAPIDATGLGADEVDALIRAAVESTSIDGAVVRLRIDHITQEVGRALNQTAIRGYKARALNFHLDERRADRARPEAIAMVRQLGSIAQRVEDKLLTTQLPNDVDRAALVELGKSYLEQATERVGDRLTSEPISIEPAAAGERRKSA